MRRKLIISLFLAAVAGIVAGEYWLNRTGAQDPLKKAEPEKKIEGSLYDILKKDLDLRKDAPPSIPLPMPVQVPPVVEKKPEAPKVIDNKAPELPPLPNFGTQTTPPPVVIPPPLTPQVDKEPVKPKDSAPVFPQLPEPSKPTVIQAKPIVDDVKPPLTSPGVPQPSKPTPEPSPKTPLPVDPPKLNPYPQIQQGYRIPPPLQTDPPKLTPDLDVPPLVPSVLQKAPAPMQPIVDEVAKIKNCPWSLHIEVIDGKTIVTATVNKKHEFKIVCQTLDLQTGNRTLNAYGKVQISADMINCSCDHLTISLTDDRLLLEGAAEARIQKVTTTVSDTKPAAFELKGGTLNLRISELEASKYLQTSWQKANIDSNVRQAAATAPAANDKRWTSFGKLVRNETKLGPVWRLEKSDGEVIAYLMPREGGTLERFVGQTISVYGMSESLHGTAVLRVTHIALP